MIPTLWQTKNRGNLILNYEGEWAANKNLERGYCLIWIEGALRGVSFSDVEPLKGAPHD